MMERHDARDAVYAEVDMLARWTDWAPFFDAARSIDRLPGVYSMRSDNRIIYVGMAGERAGSGMSKPSGLRGRLARYTSGKAAASGFGEAALDRALADVAFRQAATRRSRRRKTPPDDGVGEGSDQMARSRAPMAICPDADTAKTLEDQVVELLRPARDLEPLARSVPVAPRLSRNQ